jgi:hypothetical protein
MSIPLPALGRPATSPWLNNQGAVNQAIKAFMSALQVS